MAANWFERHLSANLNKLYIDQELKKKPKIEFYQLCLATRFQTKFIEYSPRKSFCTVSGLCDSKKKQILQQPILN